MPKSGFSLAEVLLCLCISSFLFIVFFNNHLKIKKNYYTLTNDIEYTVDFALMLDLLRVDIQSAGFTPCLKLDLIHDRLKGLEYDPFNQKIIIQKMHRNFALIQSIFEKNIIVTSQKFKAHDHVIISNCSRAALNTVSKVTRFGALYKIELTNSVLNFNESWLYIGNFEKIEYYVKNNSLMYRHNHHTEELLPSINGLNLNINPDLTYKLTLNFENKYEDFYGQIF